MFSRFGLRIELMGFAIALLIFFLLLYFLFNSHNAEEVKDE